VSGNRQVTFSITIGRSEALRCDFWLLTHRRRYRLTDWRHAGGSLLIDRSPPFHAALPTQPPPFPRAFPMVYAFP